jgi:fatty acid desaturase
VPGWLATALLALLFDWLPHHPHTVQGRYTDTRAIPSRVLEVLLLGQNLHLVHHLWPSVPWYRYGVVFREAEHALRAKGSPIVDLEDAGLPRLLTRS